MAKKRQKSSNNNRKTVKNDTKYNGKFQTSTQTTGRFRLEWTDDFIWGFHSLCVSKLDYEL